MIGTVGQQRPRCADTQSVLANRASPKPHPLALFQGFEDVESDVDILDYLEVEHAHANEIGAVFKSILKTVSGMYSSGGHDLISYPGLVHFFHLRSMVTYP